MTEARCMACMSKDLYTSLIDTPCTNCREVNRLAPVVHVPNLETKR